MSSANLHVIVGLGVTGLSCVRYLHAKGIPVAVVDTRLNPPHLEILKKEYPQVPVELGNLHGRLLPQASCLVLSPGIALATQAIAQQIQRGVPVLGDIELFAQAAKAPIIAITGTNAKSTVTTLVGLMTEKAGYRTQIGGNLGVPALDLLTAAADVFVLELSSFQLETTYSLRARVASILNLSPDHMDRYSNFAAYYAAKQRIYSHCQIAVCNRDDPLTEAVDLSIKEKIYFCLGKALPQEFGLITEEGKTYLAYDDERLLAVADLPVTGKHYQANALAALAIGHGFGLPMAPMLAVLQEFKGLPHRCTFVRERNQVRWYNDSKGTNVGATNAAIEGLGSQINSKLILIAGGVGKNADFTSLLPNVERYVRHAVLIGEAAKELAALFHGRVSTSFASSMDDAIQQADHVAKPQDYVLLSPACASLDMFKNYEHRGEVFTELVEKLL